MHPDCKKAVQDAASLCESLGHIVEEVQPEKLSEQKLNGVFGQIFSCFTGRMIAYWEEELGIQITEEQVEPMTWGSYQAGLMRTGADYLGQVEKIQRFARKVAHWYDQGGYDVLLTPTLSIPPVKLGSFDPTPDDPMR